MKDLQERMPYSISVYYNPGFADLIVGEPR